MKRLKSILSNVLNIKEDTINDGTSPDNVDMWDSFAGLMIVTELESQFNIKFTMDEIVAVKCVGDIKEALSRHGVVLNE
ncbi:MAG: acyl carrier protein [Planctomycetota bacterium]|jgi:acyl carrier protein